jgi:hypothetical protein
MFPNTLSCFILFFLFLGCSMDRIPASVARVPVPVLEDEITPCGWQALPTTSTQLLPNVKEVKCELIGAMTPETMEFSFERHLDYSRAKHSRKIARKFTLSTGENGAIYHLDYEHKKDLCESIGRWCGWSNELDLPTIESLLPDEEGKVLVQSDGGIVYRAKWQKDGSPQGIALIYCGLGGPQHSSKTLGKELIDQGWAIVYVYTVLNAPDYNTQIELTKTPYVETIIELFDTKYCQVTSATKAILEQLETELSTLNKLPLVLVGISAGALNTPSVYHELQDQVDAVVLVAGGANLFDIVQDGAFTNWKFTSNSGDFSEEQLQQLNAQYLQTPSRDPYFLAQELPQNTLLIHAKWDEVVPSESGDLLWERAGKPERWIYPSGHLGLFMTFGLHAPDVARWIQDHIH